MKEYLKDDKGNIFYQVEYWEDKGMMYSTWISTFLTVDQIKDGTLLGLEKMIECNSTIFLNDNRQLEGAWDQANDWIVNEWIPKAIDAGLVRFAHILSEDLYANLSAEFMEEYANKMEGEFKLKLFDNQEEAEKWLLENKNSEEVSERSKGESKNNS